MARKNILMGMTANEKRFMRYVTEALRGKYSKAEIPEHKREALEIYRDKLAKQCSPCFAEIADREIERVIKSLTPKTRKAKTEPEPETGE